MWGWGQGPGDAACSCQSNAGGQANRTTHAAPALPTPHPPSPKPGAHRGSTLAGAALEAVGALCGVAGAELFAEVGVARARAVGLAGALAGAGEVLGPHLQRRQQQRGAAADGGRGKGAGAREARSRAFGRAAMQRSQAGGRAAWWKTTDPLRLWAAWCARTPPLACGA